jgi:AraC-like DNA-binding protein
MPQNFEQSKIQKPLEISSIASIHYFEFDDGFEDEPEAHEAWELVYVDRGMCGVVADGKEILLRQGEMYFHKPYETHMLKTVKGIAPNIFIVTFTTESPAMHYFEGRQLAASLSDKQHISAILHEASDTFEMPFNNPKMQLMRRKTGNALWGGEQTVLIRLELMLIEIIRSNNYYVTKPKMFFPKEIITDEFALTVIAFMEDRLYGKFTMDELSHELSFGKTYISKYFLKVSGYSIIDYFNMMKINEAKRLIRESGHNFYEISEMLMFANSHYFSTIFRKHTGMTPTQYKKSCKIN